MIEALLELPASGRMRLAERMDSTPGLQVNLQLGIQRKSGNNDPADVVVQTFARRFWTGDWPGVAKPNIYYDPRAFNPDDEKRVIRVTMVVADDNAAGVTLHGRESALGPAAHLQALIDLNIVLAVPAL